MQLNVTKEEKKVKTHEFYMETLLWAFDEHPNVKQSQNTAFNKFNKLKIYRPSTFNAKNPSGKNNSKRISSLNFQVSSDIQSKAKNTSTKKKNFSNQPITLFYELYSHWAFEIQLFSTANKKAKKNIFQSLLNPEIEKFYMLFLYFMCPHTTSDLLFSFALNWKTVFIPIRLNFACFLCIQKTYSRFD